MPICTPPFIPTLAQIKASAAEIRQGWSEAEHRRRAGFLGYVSPLPRFSAGCHDTGQIEPLPPIVEYLGESRPSPISASKAERFAQVEQAARETRELRRFIASV